MPDLEWKAIASPDQIPNHFESPEAGVECWETHEVEEGVMEEVYDEKKKRFLEKLGLKREKQRKTILGHV